MKYLAIVALAVLPVLLHAQHPLVQDFYSVHKRDKGAIALRLDGWIVRAAGQISEEADVRKVTSKVDRAYVLVLEHNNTVSAGECRAFGRELSTRGYDPLMSVREQTSHVEAFVMEDRDTIYSIVLLVRDGESFVFLCIDGTFKYEDLRNLEINEEVDEYLDELPVDRA